MADKTEKTVETYLSHAPIEGWLIRRDDFKWSHGRLIAGKEANTPVVAVGADCTTWFAWAEMDRDRGDAILVAWYRGERMIGPLEACRKRGAALQPSISVRGDQGWVAWSEYDGGRWRIMVRAFREQTGEAQHEMASSVEGVFNPVVLATRSGRVWVAWEEVAGSQTRIALRSLEPGRSDLSAKRIVTDAGHAHRPVLVESADGTAWLAYDRFMTNYHVYLQRLDDPDDVPLQVSRGPFQHFQPALASDPEGNLWIAWSSNENRAVNDPWHLPRWIRLRKFDGVAFSDPVGPQKGKDLARVDVFQGWEFPATVVDARSRIWLFGQSAHTLYAQYYQGHEWSDLISYSDATWGSWKPKATAAVGPDGIIRLVAMGLQGAQFHLIDPGSSPGEAPRTIPPSSPPPAKNVGAARPDYPDIEADGEKLQVYFGDIHAHSVYSDGTGDVDEFYLRAAYGFGDDFAALTEHDYLDGLELSGSTFRWMCATARRFNQPGRFVTFSGWEWTAPAIAVHAGPGQRVGEGHKHVLYPGDEGPLYSFGSADSNSGARFIGKMKGTEAIVIPHHIGWSGCYWDYHDPELQRLVEICSAHGRYEFEGNEPIGYRNDQIYRENFVMHLLDEGYRFGFTGGSDGHGLLWHGTYPESNPGLATPGDKVGWKENAFRSGLTAIMAPELTREALWEALRRRRCYATSGAKIFLDFRVDGHLMGSEIQGGRPPRIDVKVIGAAGLQNVEVIRNGHVMSAVSVSRRQAVREIAFSLRDTHVDRETNCYYYLRVLQVDGEMAWSSPIWLDPA